MKIYGITNVFNNEAIMSLTKGGVKDKSSMYLFDRYRELYEKLEPNDKVVVPSIKVFRCVSNMVFVFNGLTAKGVSFTSIDEPKLSFTSKNLLKGKYREFIMQTLNDEETMINHLQKVYYRHVNVNEMCNGVHALNIKTVSKVFRADGILQK